MGFEGAELSGGLGVKQEMTQARYNAVGELFWGFGNEVAEEVSLESEPESFDGI